MTNNEILARWQGRCWHFFGSSGGSCIYCGQPFGYPFNCSNPDYPNDDAAAMSLLDTLVEKGFCPVLGLNGTTNLWQCDIDEFFMRGKIRFHSPVITEIGANTRREAIIAACLELARKEI